MISSKAFLALMIIIIIALVLAVYLIYFRFLSGERAVEIIDIPAQKAPKIIRLYSPAFSQGATIPKKYTCDGADISPPLKWENVPEGTKSFVIIVHDPDAPKKNFIHWIIYNIPANLRELAEGIPKKPRTDVGLQGINDFGNSWWGGPCPPWGTHRYVFRIYALDTKLNIPPGATLDQVINAMQGHVLAYGELIGKYTR